MEGSVVRQRYSGLRVCPPRSHQESVHSDQPGLTQFVWRPNGRPDELIRILPSLLQDFVIGSGDTLPKLTHAVPIDRVARDYSCPVPRGYRIEARRAVTTPDYLESEVFVTQRKHTSIFVKGSAPWNDLIEREHRP